MRLSTELESPVSVQPRVLILDDEFAQRAGICLQLSSVGYFDFIEFDDPRPALEYLRHQSVDLVIVDVRMPHLPVDGLWFMEQFRAFDFVTSIIIRTAHDDLAIADAALEARAIRRVLKSHPKASEMLRRAVSVGIVETRERRRTQHEAAAAVSTRAALVDALARTDDRITAAEMCRGFTAGLLAPIDEIARQAQTLAHLETDLATLQRLAATYQKSVEQLRAQVAAFLGNAYFAGSDSLAGGAALADCFEALAAALHQHPLLRRRELQLDLHRPTEPLYFLASPPRVLTALRHLTEYCALHARANSTLTVESRLEASPRATLDAAKPGQFVLNGKAATGQPCLAVDIRAQLEHFNLELLRSALRQCSEDPAVANLLMLSAAVIDDQLVFETSLSADQASTFTLYLPAIPGR